MFEKEYKFNWVRTMKIFLYIYSFFIVYYLYSDVAPSHFTVTLSKPIAKASSFLREKKRAHPAQQAVDSKIETAWCEGASGSGIGETLELQFQPTGATKITVLNGYGENRKLYENNNRVKDYEVTITTRNGRFFKKKGQFIDNGCMPGDERDCEYLNMPNSLKEYDSCIQEIRKNCVEADGSLGNDILLNEPLCITKIEIKILSIYKGNKFDDTCIAEVKLVQPDPLFSENNQIEVLKLQKSCK